MFSGPPGWCCLATLKICLSQVSKFSLSVGAEETCVASADSPLTTSEQPDYFVWVK